MNQNWDRTCLWDRLWTPSIAAGTPIVIVIMHQSARPELEHFVNRIEFDEASQVSENEKKISIQC